MPDTAKPRKKLQTVQVRMDDETLETLKAIANEEHRTVSNLIGKFIQDALKEREKHVAEAERGPSS